MRKSVLRGALGALCLVAPVALGQVHPSAQPAVSRHAIANQGGVMQPIGPGDFFPASKLQADRGRMMDLSESALMQPARATEGGFTDLRTSVVPIGDGDISTYIDQPYSCDNGFYSNNNHNSNPYLTFDDFVADGSPLRNVRFYGGTTGDMFSDVNYIGIEIWSIQSGGACGWTYASLQGGQSFSLAELSPTYVCDVSGAYPSYEMLATFATPIQLNAGQNYMITIYANLNDPDGNLYFWNQSTVNNYNPSESWDRTTGNYVRCGPDAAFATNVGGSCFENDCSTTCYFSNFTNNNSPYIVLDDFIADATGDLRHLVFSGGGWDISTGTPTGLGNTAGFRVELYHAYADQNYLCQNYVDNFYGLYEVTKADATPKFQCFDIFGIPQYQFSVSIPAGVLPLTAGEHYMLGVYGLPADPDDPELFCWGGTDAIYGFTSWSYDLGTGQQTICHDVDQAFCVNPAQRPCLGDYDNNGAVNTIDVLRFLNDWAAGSLAADCNGDGRINTQDVLCFLNRWAAGC